MKEQIVGERKRKLRLLKRKGEQLAISALKGHFGSLPIN